MRDSNTVDALRYALAKQVPAMERGFTIQTNYGSIEIAAEDAERVASIVRSILLDNLAREEVAHG
ncbi:hypothetical protein WJ96_33225 [Burkholderia ubonensis]|uniref:Uncharacterized protein n=1 Tax=Burkholderia ubonensis TaxID=101571 RepID=A0AAW3N208_9BURK|nr:hypothetical protein [Burkholderia ubonensis]KVQ01856.1 hypothetical protein WJ96_33225 [Burkholderia ubonensis]KVZ88264.1 hypothetical protein WL25_26480 [Burkholderia ubonensis]